MLKFLKYISPVLFIFPVIVFISDAHAIERRRNQFLDEQGYYVFITPYSLPGIGGGAGLVGAVSNVANSYTDLYTYILDGDLEGGGFAISDVHILSKRLVFDLTGSKFRKIII
ncbi:MAG: hypothetical protein OEV42_13255 [Deltaproteobacteria bacterium]|nr:hypothetical protein [Deltaproteobacteria bacterium]